MKQLPTIRQSFKVNYSYELRFTRALFAIDNPLLKSVYANCSPKPITTVVLIDDGVTYHHKDLVSQIETYAKTYSKQFDLRKILSLKGGEQSKADNEVLEEALSVVNDFQVCRHSFIIAIGGGAFIDTVGYAASIAHRGVKLIRVPTTVLAQNDAAVGVKNGINHFGKKNFLGTFTVPYAIINDFDFLKTLDQRDWISGIAEAIKVALIKDASFFEFIEKNALSLSKRNMEPMSFVIYRCAELHMQHIAEGGDPFESGSSRPLDFGHWAAHKLEQMTHYQLRHGEAVAIGIALDITYAQMIGLISEDDKNRILQVFKNIGFNLSIPFQNEDEINELLLGISEFREHLGGILTITLLSDIGKKYDVNAIDDMMMREAIRERMETEVYL